MSGSYVYGRLGTTVEQIASGGTVTYLHHDQAGSTRLITGSTGTVTGKCTHSAYGTPTFGDTATTPLGFDGEYELWAELGRRAAAFKSLPVDAEVVVDIWIEHYGEDLRLGWVLDRRHVSAAAAFGASLSVDEYDETE